MTLWHCHVTLFMTLWHCDMTLFMTLWHCNFLLFITLWHCDVTLFITVWQFWYCDTFSYCVILMFQKLLRNPLVNVACWHIQCKDCWFETLVSSFLGQIISKYNLEVYSYVSFNSFSGHEEVLQRMWCIDYSWGLEKSLSVIWI